MTRDRKRIRRGSDETALPPPVKTVSSKPPQDHARRFLQTELQAAATMKEGYAWKAFDFLQINHLAEELKILTDNVSRNDLSGLERMLAAQIYTLDQIFHLMMRRGVGDGLSLEHCKAYMNCALRAQSQTRAAIETMAEIKNPKPFMQQQNIAYNQQINNSARSDRNASPVPRVRERNRKAPNKLLSDRKELTRAPLDSGGTQTSISTNPDMEAVGAIHRPTNR